MVSQVHVQAAQVDVVVGVQVRDRDGVERDRLDVRLQRAEGAAAEEPKKDDVIDADFKDVSDDKGDKKKSA